MQRNETQHALSAWPRLTKRETGHGSREDSHRIPPELLDGQVSREPDPSTPFDRQPGSLLRDFGSMVLGHGRGDLELFAFLLRVSRSVVSHEGPLHEESPE
jgi:hypothetical protein